MYCMMYRRLYNYECSSIIDRKKVWGKIENQPTNMQTRPVVVFSTQNNQKTPTKHSCRMIRTMDPIYLKQQQRVTAAATVHNAIGTMLMVAIVVMITQSKKMCKTRATRRNIMRI